MHRMQPPSTSSPGDSIRPIIAYCRQERAAGAARSQFFDRAISTPMPPFNLRESMLQGSTPWNNRYVEVHHILADTELLVESDRGVVAIIGLNVYHPYSAARCDFSELLN